MKRQKQGLRDCPCTASSTTPPDTPRPTRADCFARNAMRSHESSSRLGIPLTWIPVAEQPTLDILIAGRVIANISNSSLFVIRETRQPQWRECLLAPRR
jgi:hypothetical protein